MAEPKFINQCKPGEHQLQFAECREGIETYNCNRCPFSMTQFNDLCSGG